MGRVVAALYNDLCVFTRVHNVIEKIVTDAWMTVLAHGVGGGVSGCAESAHAQYLENY